MQVKGTSPSSSGAAGGLSQGFPHAEWYAQVRTLRLADGPDEMHKNALAHEIRRMTKRD